MALHRADQTPVGLLARLVDQPLLQEDPERDRDEDDHQRAADELADDELPAHQQPEHDPELGDEVGRGDLERDRSGEVGAAAEERPGERDRRVRARRRGRAEAGRDRQRLRAVIRHQSTHLLFRDDGLDETREREAEDQRPENLPEHPERERERVDELPAHIGGDDSGHPVSLIAVTTQPLRPLFPREQRKGVPKMLSLLMVIALLLLLFGVIGGIAISKFLFFVLIVAAIVFLLGLFTRTA